VLAGVLKMKMNTQHPWASSALFVLQAAWMLRLRNLHYKQPIVSRQQSLVHGAALHVATQIIEPEEAFANLPQGFRLSEDLPILVASIFFIRNNNVHILIIFCIFLGSILKCIVIYLYS
jgi:hypothetical protein